MKESDWKIFKQIKERAIDLFCNQALEEFEEVMQNEKETAYDRYLILYNLIQERDKHMQLLFDGHSRSRVPLQLHAMRGKDLAEESLIDQLSEELRQSTDPERHKC